MLRTALRARLRDAHLDDGYLSPAYGDYCFDRVPATVASVLGVDAGRTLPDDVFDGVETGVERVVVVLVDGLGFEQWQRDYRDHPFLEAVTERGTVSPLTTVFPSETAAAITTMHTGRQPAEHGLTGWDVPVAGGAVVESLPFRTRAGEDPEAALGFEPADLFDGTPVYRRLADAGVAARVVQPASTLDTAYSRMTLDGAERTGYETAAGMALQTRRALADADGPTYVYGYLPHVDAVSHRHGTGSGEYRADLGMLSGCLRRELVDGLDPGTAAETLLVVVADHGELDTVPAENVDLLSRDAVAESLRRTPDGDRVPPTGGPRQAHLHLREGTVGAVRRSLENDLDALVLTREEVLDAGLYGDREPGRRLVDRVGDLVVVHRNRSTWYDEGDGAALSLVGQHGGLSPREMLVPFAAVRLDRLA